MCLPADASATGSPRTRVHRPGGRDLCTATPSPSTITLPYGCYVPACLRGLPGVEPAARPCTFSPPRSFPASADLRMDGTSTPPGLLYGFRRCHVRTARILRLEEDFGSSSCLLPVCAWSTGLAPVPGTPVTFPCAAYTSSTTAGSYSYGPPGGISSRLHRFSVHA